MIKLNFLIILLSHALISLSTLALPYSTEENQERDISFNVFRLDSNLKTSNILNFAKCVDYESVDGVTDLLSSTVKLDCNSHTNEASFCKCVEIISGENIDLAKIEKKYEKEYKDFLKNNDSLKKEISGEIILKDYINTRSLLGNKVTPNNCSPQAESLYQELESAVFQHYPTEKMRMAAVLDIELGNKGNIDTDSVEYMILNHKDNINYQEELRFINNSYQVHNSSIKTFNIFFPGAKHVPIPIVSNTYNSIIETSIQEHVKDNDKRRSLGVNFYRSIIERVSTNFNSTEPVAEIREELLLNSIEEEMTNELTAKCYKMAESLTNVMNNNFEDIKDLDKTMDQRIEHLINSGITSKDSEFSFRSFVDKKISEKENSPNELINKRFQADIYFCHKRGQYEKAEDFIELTMEDQKKVEELNKLTEELKSYENNLRNEKSHRNVFSGNIKELEEHLELIESQQKLIEENLAKNIYLLSSTEKSTPGYKEIEEEILEQREALESYQRVYDSRKSEIATHREEIKEVDRNIIKYQENIAATNKKINSVFNGNKDAAKMFLASAMSGSIEGSLISYDENSNSVSINKNAKNIIKNSLEKGRLAKFKNYNEAIQSKKKTLRKIATTPVLSPKKVKSIKEYYKKPNPSTEETRTISNFFEEIPSNKLQPAPRKQQDKLAAIKSYEKELQDRLARLNSRDQQKETNGKRTSSISENKELEELRRKISSLKADTLKISNSEVQATKNKVQNKQPLPTRPQEIAQNSTIKATNNSRTIASQEKPQRVSSTKTAQETQVAASLPTNSTVATQAISPKTGTQEQDQFSLSTDKSINQLNSDNIINETTLSEEDFAELNLNLDISSLKKYNLNAEKLFTVNTKNGQVVYEPILENGKLLGFKKVSFAKKSEVKAAYKKEIKKVQEIRRRVVNHKDLVNILSTLK